MHFSDRVCVNFTMEGVKRSFVFGYYMFYAIPSLGNVCNDFLFSELSA